MNFNVDIISILDSHIYFHNIDNKTLEENSIAKFQWSFQEIYSIRRSRSTVLDNAIEIWIKGNGEVYHNIDIDKI